MLEKQGSSHAVVPHAHGRRIWASARLRFPACWLLSFLLSCIVVLAAWPVAANPSFDDLGCTRPLRVAVFEFGPWYRDGAGITVDLLDAVTARTGCSFELVPVSRADSWSALEAGSVDIIPNSIQTDERLKLARFVPFLRIRNLMVVRADTEQAPDSVDAFVSDRAARLGIIKGFRYGSYFDFRLQALLGDERTIAVDDPGQLVDLVRRSEVEGILLPAGHYFVYATDMERQALFRVLDTSSSLPNASGFALSRAAFSKVQSENWLRLIEKFYLDRTIELLATRHLPPRIAATIARR